MKLAIFEKNSNWLFTIDKWNRLFITAPSFENICFYISKLIPVSKKFDRIIVYINILFFDFSFSI